MGKVNQFLTHVVPGVIRPLRVLWNEVIGFIFFVLGVAAIPSTVRHIREFDGHADSFFRVALPIAFAAIMGYFAVSSFLKARKISKS
jgi:hypothetical protein